MKDSPREQPPILPEGEIMKKIFDAATADPWRPSHRLVEKALPLSATVQTHSANFRSSLDRARRKTFVRAARPLRRLLRNQGAVNDGLVDALFHLAAEVDAMLEEMSELRNQIASLKESGAGPAAEETTTQPDAE